MRDRYITRIAIVTLINADEIIIYLCKVYFEIFMHRISRISYYLNKLYVYIYIYIYIELLSTAK